MGRRLLVILLCLALTLQGCAFPKAEQAAEGSTETVKDNEAARTAVSDGSIDLQTIEDAVYEEAINCVGAGYFIENVEARYVSQEYLDELAYNSQANLYFGFTLEELEETYDGGGYLFTVDSNGKTTTKAFEEYEPEFDTTVRNLAVGGGVILVCVTVSAVTAGSAPAVSMVLAVAATEATKAAVVGGALGAAAGAINTGIQTGDPEEALKSAALLGSEGFKVGAIGGAIGGAASELAGLYGASRNGLTMSQAATIQRESKWSLETIKSFHSQKEYELYKKAGLVETTVNGKKALVQKIDWNLKDENGITNAERVRDGLAPIDADGKSYELHHVGQKTDSPLAVLTDKQHRSKGNYSTLHKNEGPGVHSEISDAEWSKQKREFWLNLLEQTEKV